MIIREKSNIGMLQCNSPGRIERTICTVKRHRNTLLSYPLQAAFHMPPESRHHQIKPLQEFIITLPEGKGCHYALIIVAKDAFSVNNIHITECGIA